MTDTPHQRFGYTPFEETLNISTHALGLVLSIIAGVFLLHHGFTNGTLVHQVSFAVFAGSLCLLYAASTGYHSAQRTLLRAKMRILDHAAIYLFIAGTYTPFALVTLKGRVGWTLFGVSWAIAAVGVVFKIFFTGRFMVFSTLMYVAMGWVVLIAIKPLIAALPLSGMLWLSVGGALYNLGAFVFLFHKLKLNHAIFHCLVLGGSFCHYVAVYFYVLPKS